VVLLGESGVGKSSIVNKLTNNIHSDHGPTIGAEFCQLTLVETKNNIDTITKLQIWDTAGQERYRSIMPMYYRDADIIIFVYDGTDIITLEKITNFWYKEVKDYFDKENSTKILHILVENKYDLIENNQSNISSIQLLDIDKLHMNKLNIAQAMDANFVRVSAKTGYGLDNLIDIINFHKPQKEIKSKDMNLVKIIGNNEFNKKNYCCN
jgi:small GTP-binding protein